MPPAGSCALDVVEAHPEGRTLDQVATLIGCSKQRVHQIEKATLKRPKAKRAFRPLRAALIEGPERFRRAVQPSELTIEPGDDLALREALDRRFPSKSWHDAPMFALAAARKRRIHQRLARGEATTAELLSVGCFPSRKALHKMLNSLAEAGQARRVRTGVWAHAVPPEEAARLRSVRRFARRVKRPITLQEVAEAGRYQSLRAAWLALSLERAFRRTEAGAYELLSGRAA